MSVMLPSGKLSVERQNMKLKQKKAPVVRKVTKAVAKRTVTTKAASPKLSLIKARVVAVRPAPAAITTDAATLAMPAGNIVPLPENFDPENEEPTQEALQKEQETEVKPVTMEEIRQAYDGDTAYQLYLKEIGQTAIEFREIVAFLKQSYCFVVMQARKRAGDRFQLRDVALERFQFFPTIGQYPFDNREDQTFA